MKIIKWSTVTLKRAEIFEIDTHLAERLLLDDDEALVLFIMEDHIPVQVVDDERDNEHDGFTPFGE